MDGRRDHRPNLVGNNVDYRFAAACVFVGY